MNAPALTLHRRCRAAYARRLPTVKRRRRAPLLLPPSPVRLALPVPKPEPDAPAWRRAARAARERAVAVHGEHAATLRQLNRVCQLLTSHVVEDRERRKALRYLAAGCTKTKAGEMLDYLIPVVPRRKAREAAEFLAPLAAA